MTAYRLRSNVSVWGASQPPNIHSHPIDLDLYNPGNPNPDHIRNLDVGLSFDPPVTQILIEDETHEFGHQSGFVKKRFPPGRCYQNKVVYSVPLLPDFTWADGHSFVIVGNRPRLPLDQGWPGHLQDDYGSSGFPTKVMMPLVPSSSLKSLGEEAFNYFSTMFPTTLSFGEFVQGFSQLKDLIPEVGDSIMKTISGGYLNKKFGWDNLLADLGTLGSMWKSTLDRMDYFRRTYGIPTRLGFNRNNIYSFNKSAYDFNHTTWLPGFGCRAYLTDYRADFRSTAYITQTLDYVDGLAGFMRVLFGELGLNNPIKAFWNTIPLSFVVDWFFKISQHLDHLTRLNPATGWDVNNVTHSVKYSATWTLEPYGTPGYGVVYDHAVSGSIIREIYERNVGLSFDLETLVPDELSPSQLTLLLAMLHQLG